MVTRQSYQQGYVSGAIRTRSGVVFKIRYRVRTGEGKWKQKSETLYGLARRKEARAVLDERLRETTICKVGADDLTVRDFVGAYWRPYLDRKGVKPSTRMSYESALEKHVFPLLGELKLGDVVPLHIENLVQTKLKGGLSAKTVRNLVGLLQGIFSLAADNDLVVRSPIREKHKPNVPRREKPVWTPDQVRAILNEVPTNYGALFACAGLTGARLGELLGLQWKHMNLETRTLRIEQSLWHGQLLPPKTPGSVRTLPFGGALASALREHFQNAVHRGGEDFVFCKPDGNPLHPDLLRKDVLYPTLDRLNIPRTSGESGFHTFRHSVASFINSQTGNLKLAQKLLGHSNLETTANIYTHISVEQEREAALAVERAIYGDLFPVVPKIGNRNNIAAVN